MNMRRGVSLCAALVCVCAATVAHADLDVGAGSSLSFGDGALDLGCSHLTVAGSFAGGNGAVGGIANLAIASGGTLAPGAAGLALGGDFSDAGTFTPDTSAVSIVDACGSGTSSVSGSTNFHDLLVRSATGKRLVLPAALTQRVAHALTLQGAAGNLLQVSSSAPGQQALLDVAASATQSIVYVDARDDKASGATIAAGPAASYRSVDAGNLTHWFGDAVANAGGGTAPLPVPALGTIAQLALLSGVLFLAARRRGISMDAKKRHE